ncbi:sensor histidine kinase [Cochleicola gelatinilyticus]|nr:PAS domain-containing sensor histidine kinase [Cochleicola gelatinilyticus]
MNCCKKKYLLNFAEKITMTGNWQTNVITKTVKWSANFYRIMGLEENTEVTFNTYLEHVHPEDIERVKLHQQNTLKNNKFEDLVHRIKLQDGTVKIVRVRANINVNEFGDIIDIIGTCQDITEQKASEQKIIQAKENLIVLTQHLSGQNKQLEDFAHISSHNLRSPVSNLNALLHLYRISETEEEREELFEKFETVISHLTTTLNTLIEALKTKKECEKELEILEFDHILRKTKEIISQKISGTNAIITSDFSKTPKIKYDKTYLESIFLNLVSNAVKYRSPNRAPEVHIKTEIIDGKIKLTFQDNGLGIDLKKHGHKLFGLNKTFHRHPEAKGVGLYLTKVQIESMGGKIYATSEVNKGSVFTVIFNENRHEEPL